MPPSPRPSGRQPAGGAGRASPHPRRHGPSPCRFPACRRCPRASCPCPHPLQPLPDAHPTPARRPGSWGADPRHPGHRGAWPLGSSGMPEPLPRRPLRPGTPDAVHVRRDEGCPPAAIGRAPRPSPRHGSRLRSAKGLRLRSLPVPGAPGRSREARPVPRGKAQPGRDPAGATRPRRRPLGLPAGDTPDCISGQAGRVPSLRKGHALAGRGRPAAGRGSPAIAAYRREDGCRRRTGLNGGRRM